MEQKAEEKVCLIIHNEYSEYSKKLSSKDFNWYYGAKVIEEAFKYIEFFNNLKKTVQENPAYLDKSVDVQITEYKIQFNLSLKEINYIFPETVEMIQDSFLKIRLKVKSFSEENIESYCRNLYLKFNVSVKLSHLQNNLNKEAKDYFRSRKFQPVPKVKENQLENKKPANVLFELLKCNEGLVLGESSHSGASGKRLLIDNFASLKEAGVTHLFIEHLLADTQTHLLDQYFHSEDEEMPKALECYLKGLDKSFMVNDKQYNFSQLIVAAKEAGIRVVPIDTSVSSSTDSSVYLYKNAEGDRYRMMNYVAAKQFEKHKTNSEPPLNKFIVFCGSGHVKEMHIGVPGVSEITGCPAVVIKDMKSNDKKESIVVNPEIDIEHTKPDVLMIVDPEKSLAADSSKVRILKTKPKRQLKGKPSNYSTNVLNKKLNQLIEEKDLTTLLNFWRFFNSEQEAKIDEITTSIEPSLTLSENPTHQPGNLGALPYANSVKEILIVLGNYAELLNQIDNQQQKEALENAIKDVLMHLNIIFESLNKLQPNNADNERLLSEITNEFNALDESIKATDSALVVLNRVDEQNNPISTLTSQQEKAQSYNQAIEAAKAAIPRLKTAQYGLYAAVLMAVVTAIVIGFFATLPYIAIPVSIVFLALVASEMAKWQKYAAEETEKVNTEALKNMPKTLSNYLQAEFKPVVSTFFQKKDGNLLNDQNPAIQKFLDNSTKTSCINLSGIVSTNALCAHSNQAKYKKTGAH